MYFDLLQVLSVPNGIDERESVSDKGAEMRDVGGLTKTEGDIPIVEGDVVQSAPFSFPTKINIGPKTVKTRTESLVKRHCGFHILRLRRNRHCIQRGDDTSIARIEVHDGASSLGSNEILCKGQSIGLKMELSATDRLHLNLNMIERRFSKTRSFQPLSLHVRPRIRHPAAETLRNRNFVLKIPKRRDRSNPFMGDDIFQTLPGGPVHHLILAQLGEKLFEDDERPRSCQVKQERR